MADQFYVFTVPGEELVWAETFLSDGTHVVAPMPFCGTEDAMTYLMGENPGATVDELFTAADIERARTWARTVPLEQLPA